MVVSGTVLLGTGLVEAGNPYYLKLHKAFVTFTGDEVAFQLRAGNWKSEFMDLRQAGQHPEDNRSFIQP